MDYLFVLQTLRENCPQFINYFFLFLSEYFMKVLIFVFAVIYWGFSKQAGLIIALGYSGTYTLNQTVKNIACVYRPWIRDSRLYVFPAAEAGATGYSFPSGHTVSAAYFLGSGAVWKKDKKWFCGICIALIVLVAFARNWLGAHTLTDVICALGNACLGICLTNIIAYWFSKNEDKDYLVVTAAVAVSVIVLLFMEFKGYPVSYDSNGAVLSDPYLMKTDCYSACGMTCGGFIAWFLERRFVKMEDTSNTRCRIIRILIGAAGVSLFFIGLNPVYKLIDRNIGHLIKYFLIFFYTFYVSPYLFKKLKLF